MLWRLAGDLPKDDVDQAFGPNVLTMIKARIAIAS
jgi:hypothetical protein